MHSWLFILIYFNCCIIIICFPAPVHSLRIKFKGNISFGVYGYYTDVSFYIFVFMMNHFIAGVLYRFVAVFYKAGDAMRDHALDQQLTVTCCTYRAGFIICEAAYAYHAA